MGLLLLVRRTTIRRHQRQVLRRCCPRTSRYMQSAAAAAAAAPRRDGDKPSSSPPPPPTTRQKQQSKPSPTSSPPSSPSISHPIPHKHSRNKLPLICVDPMELQELTQEIMETPVGSLFSYASSGRDSALDAWRIADPTVQKVEYLVRGHSHTIPGTQWNRWLPTRTSKDQDQDQQPEQPATNATTLETIYKLTDRMWDEGHSYMTLREARLEELYGPKPKQQLLTKAVDLDDDDGMDLEEALLLEEEKSSSKQQLQELDNKEENDMLDDIIASRQKKLAVEEEVAGTSTDDDDDDEVDVSYMDDFALPGPTTHMYDVLLDAMACSPSSSAGGSSNTDEEFVITPELTLEILENILGRHELDGGDLKNASVHTRPTLLSYNAPIRVAASCFGTYDNTTPSSTKRPKEIQARDDALQIAFGSYGELSSSDIYERNSATYAYLLQVVAKYLPASRIRGNIAYGMFHHARTQGLIDDTVVQAFRLANTPTNGTEFDNFIESKLQQVDMQPINDILPIKWTRHSRKRRHHPREATY